MSNFHPECRRRTKERNFDARRSPGASETQLQFTLSPVRISSFANLTRPATRESTKFDLTSRAKGHNKTFLVHLRNGYSQRQSKKARDSSLVQKALPGDAHFAFAVRSIFPINQLSINLMDICQGCAHYAHPSLHSRSRDSILPPN